MKLTKEQATDINLLLALMRCFSEQLYMVKGAHSGLVKQKFSRLIKVANQYEREVVRMLGESQEMDAIYDAMMELILIVKEQINEGEKEGEKIGD